MAQSVQHYGHFDNLVFENRNKSYGAYQIRKSYTTNGLIGVGFALLLVVALIVTPIISAWIKSMKPKPKAVVEETHVRELTNPKSLDEEEEKPEVKKVEQKVEQIMESVKFTVPIITTDPVDDVVTSDDIQ